MNHRPAKEIRIGLEDNMMKSLSRATCATAILFGALAMAAPGSALAQMGGPDTLDPKPTPEWVEDAGTFWSMVMQGNFGWAWAGDPDGPPLVDPGFGRGLPADERVADDLQIIVAICW